MATQTTSLTTSEFAKAAGVSSASISKLIRDGKLKAKKEGGKWMIPQSQLEAEAVRALKGPAKASPSKSARGKLAPAPETAPARQPQEKAAAVPPEPEPLQAAATPAPAPEEKTYTIAEFAAMTYLTEKGVAEWLKIGRIKGIQKDSGAWRVLECNLQVPDISRLLRK
jgi:excisionase family DNA binding protein